MTKKDKPTKKYFFLKILGALAAVVFILSAVSFPLRTVRYTLVSRKVTKKCASFRYPTCTVVHTARI